MNDPLERQLDDTAVEYIWENGVRSTAFFLLAEGEMEDACLVLVEAGEDLIAYIEDTPDEEAFA